MGAAGDEGLTLLINPHIGTWGGHAGRQCRVAGARRGAANLRQKTIHLRKGVIMIITHLRKLQNVLDQESEAKEKLQELKRRRQEVDDMRREKLKKLVCITKKWQHITHMSHFIITQLRHDEGLHLVLREVCTHKPIPKVRHHHILTRMIRWESVFASQSQIKELPLQTLLLLFGESGLLVLLSSWCTMSYHPYQHTAAHCCDTSSPSVESAVSPYSSRCTASSNPPCSRSSVWCPPRSWRPSSSPAIHPPRPPTCSSCQSFHSGCVWWEGGFLPAAGWSTFTAGSATCDSISPSKCSDWRRRNPPLHKWTSAVHSSQVFRFGLVPSPMMFVLVSWSDQKLAFYRSRLHQYRK